MSETKDLRSLLSEPLANDDDIAWDYAMEISGSVYARMKELGWKKKDLAVRMGVSPARITRILSGEQKMTLTTLARLGNVLGLDMSYGFKHPVLRTPRYATEAATVLSFDFMPQGAPRTADIAYA